MKTFEKEFNLKTNLETLDKYIRSILKKNDPPTKHMMLHISMKDFGKDFLKSSLSPDRYIFFE